MNSIGDTACIAAPDSLDVLHVCLTMSVHEIFVVWSAHSLRRCARILCFRLTKVFLFIVSRSVNCGYISVNPHLGVWNGCYFEAVTLKDLGLTIQLGHDGAKCPMSVTGPSNFTVIHINSIHNVRVAFCGCSNSFGILRWHQLMCIGWFPSTTSYPETCTTFQALWQCHLLMLHSKLSTFQFYGTLSHLTDNTGLSVPPVWAHHPNALCILLMWSRTATNTSCAWCGNGGISTYSSGPGVASMPKERMVQNLVNLHFNAQHVCNPESISARTGWKNMMKNREPQMLSLAEL